MRLDWKQKREAHLRDLREQGIAPDQPITDPARALKDLLKETGGSREPSDVALALMTNPQREQMITLVILDSRWPIQRCCICGGAGHLDGCTALELGCWEEGRCPACEGLGFHSNEDAAPWANNKGETYERKANPQGSC